MRPLREIAQEVRRWADHVVAQPWGKRHDFTPSLACFCVPATLELFRQLKKEGYEPALGLACDGDLRFYNAGHCFVICNNMIVDVTASQFTDAPSVVVRDARKADRWYWKPAKVYQSVQGLLWRLQRDDWNYQPLRVPRAVCNDAWKELRS